MKDYNEMANSVFRRRDEFVAMRKKRNGILIKAGTSVCALLLVAVVGVSVWRALPHIPSVKPTEPTTTVSADTTEDTSQTQEANTIKTKPAVVETQEKTEGVQAGNTQNPVLPYDPVESTPAGNTDKPQTGETLPPDPTEPKGDKPATGETPDTTLAGSADSGKPTLPGWTPGTVPSESTAVVEPTTAIEVTLATLPYEPTEPTIGDFTETTEPTEPVTGPLYIECDGKTYEAQTGDMVTLTVELQADEPIKSAYVLAKYGYNNLEIVNLRELGFTDKQRKEAHTPNFGNVMCVINYDDGIYGKFKATRVDFSVPEKDEALDFTEKKVFFTFSFIVKKPGAMAIEIVPNDITSINGTEYFDYGNQLVTDGIELEAYLTITPESQVKLPTPPVEEETEPSEETSFTYPAESAEGDLVINCDGRTYSANVGDTVTYVVEMEVEKPVGGIQATLDFGDGELDIIVPESKKGKVWFPNLYGLSYNHEAGLKEDGTDDCLMKMSAIDLYGFDFKRRKVLMTFDFLVKKPGEIDLKMDFEEMYSLSTKDSFFKDSEQVTFEGIWIYEYVLVK